MKEALKDKVKYLLSYQLQTNNPNYRALVENIFYEFIENMEKIYNEDHNALASYYTYLLNRLNQNIKSIIIPAKEFRYHPLGFLEFSTNLTNQITPYVKSKIPINHELKEKILKKTYYFYLLQALKKKNTSIGFFSKEKKMFKALEQSFTELQAITLSSLTKFYRKDYQTMYPDGTTYHYFIYTNSLESSEPLNINACRMIEILFGKTNFIKAELEGDFSIFENFDHLYDHLLGDLQYDKFGKKAYTPSEVLCELLKRIQKEKSLYKKMEYFKKFNFLILEIFDYKVTEALVGKKEEDIKKIQEEIKILETCMLYNTQKTLHDAMAHVQLLKKIALKLQNYQEQSKKEEEAPKYTIYNLDNTKQEEVSSSIEPILVGQDYVLIHIKEVRGMNNRVLICADIDDVSRKTFIKKIYTGVYFSVKSLRDLYTSIDTGKHTIESIEIREKIANRIINPTIMDIIKRERNNFLGEFIYSEKEKRCIVYKNKSIEEALKETVTKEKNEGKN